MSTDKSYSPKSNEIQLTDAMQSFAKVKEMYSWNFKGRRYDIGTMEDWFRSHFELSMKSSFSRVIQNYIGSN